MIREEKKGERGERKERGREIDKERVSIEVHA